MKLAQLDSQFLPAITADRQMLKLAVDLLDDIVSHDTSVWPVEGGANVRRCLDVQRKGSAGLAAAYVSGQTVTSLPACTCRISSRACGFCPDSSNSIISYGMTIIGPGSILNLCSASLILSRSSLLACSIASLSTMAVWYARAEFSFISTSNLVLYLSASGFAPGMSGFQPPTMNHFSAACCRLVMKDGSAYPADTPTTSGTFRPSCSIARPTSSESFGNDVTISASGFTALTLLI